MVTVCDVSRDSSVFMVLIVRFFLQFIYIYIYITHFLYIIYIYIDIDMYNINVHLQF